MAIERTGTPQIVAGGTANTGSTSISVPADATFALVYVVGYENVTNFFSGGSITLGGQAMTSVAADGDTTKYLGAAFYKASPLTGTQTLAWDWAGSSTISVAANEPKLVYEFWKGVNTASPVRDTFGGQFTAPQYSTDSLTAASGDKIAVWVFGFVNAEGSVTTWSNATEVAEFTRTTGGDDNDGTLAEHSPTGDVTIATTATVAYGDGGIIAIVVQPEAGAAQALPAGAMVGV